MTLQDQDEAANRLASGAILPPRAELVRLFRCSAKGNIDQRKISRTTILEIKARDSHDRWCTYVIQWGSRTIRSATFQGAALSCWFFAGSIDVDAVKVEHKLGPRPSCVGPQWLGTRSR
jgi:hypothetical protein